MQIININRGMIIAKEVQRAETFWARFKGLMGTKSLADHSALLIKPCNAIHTCFMKYSIDVIFLDVNNRVLHILHSIPPFRFFSPVAGAKCVIELPSGRCTSTGTRVGDLLKINNEVN